MIRYALGLLFLASALAADHKGQVTFTGLPIPGVTVTATRDGKKRTCVTDEQGFYTLADLSDGPWTLETEMTGFAPMTREIAIAPNASLEKWELKLLPIDQVKAMAPTETHLAPAVSAAPSAAPKGEAEEKPKEAKQESSGKAEQEAQARPMGF